ncbi:MAG TPA: hypothetical protein VHT68_08480 [Pseudolabrys sp.]|jgi:hypothetical protein|nr:hypothetical protein [Pseudolabrys sp.]
MKWSRFRDKGSQFFVCTQVFAQPKAQARLSFPPADKKRQTPFQRTYLIMYFLIGSKFSDRVLQNVNLLISTRAISKSGERACHPAACYLTLSFMKTMKKLFWLLPFLIILGAMLLTVIERSAQTHEVTITYDYGNLIDTRGHYHSVQLVMHLDGAP